jgi:CAAX prenyl protease-like protein
MGRQNPGAAHLLPLTVFLLIGAAGELVDGKDHGILWVYPLQALLCLAVLGWLWPAYSFGPLRGWRLVLLTAPLGWLVWIAPSQLYLRFGAPAWLEGHVPGFDLPWRSLVGLDHRAGGFDPAAYQGTGVPPLAGLALRFVRLVITVPLVEEICWRGFVMRLVDDLDKPFYENSFGHHRWRTYAVVTGLVVLAHHPVDWVGAFAFGSMVYLIAVRTKSLGACVLFHALVNLLLGVYVVATQQWGYW